MNQAIEMSESATEAGATVNDFLINTTNPDNNGTKTDGQPGSGNLTSLYEVDPEKDVRF